MASACCLHQISGPPVGSNGLKQQETDRRGATPSSLLGLRSPWLCSHGRRRLLQSTTSGLSNSRNHRTVAATSAATALVRTIATTPDSEVGASDAEDNSVTDGKAAEVLDDAEKTEEEKLEDTEKREQEPKKPRYKRPKSLIHILETLHKQAIEAATKDRQIPDIRPGYVVQIKLEVPETKRRVSMLRGIVICRRNSGVNTTFTIRRIIAGVGVEMVFPLYSPNIKEITVLAKKKVRRAKLYYLRNKLAKFSSF